MSVLFDLAPMQWISSTALTLASVTIAFVAAMFGYRQNYGWRPVLLVTSESLSETGGGDEYVASIDVEFWNRRKYPVVIRAVEADFGELRLHEVQSASGEMETWHTFHGKPVFRDKIRVDPAGHHSFAISGAFKGKKLDDVDVMATISVFYFDPVANKERPLEIKHRYFWKAEEE